MCIDGVPTHGRYARDILALQERLNYRSLLSMQVGGGSYAARRPDGLVTLGLRTDQLTGRHLLGLQGFRLAQYLQLGWVCEDAIAAQGMFCEPTSGVSNHDVHLVTLSGTGEILGYLGMAGSGDDLPMDLRDPLRDPFPVETAHGINLFDLVPAGRPVTSHQVRELKRFVHRRSMTDRGLRLRVTLELLLAAGQMALLQADTRMVVGDVEENVALRHLVMAGLRVRLIEGTTPQLNTAHYLHLAYTKRAAVRPFVAEVELEQVQRRMRVLDAVLSAGDPGLAVRSLMTDRSGSVERVAA